MNSEVLYSRLTPGDLKKRIDECPVGYLPLGTLEWHCFHLPIGTDAIEAYDLFRMVAGKAGGVVFPPLFLGPDITRNIDGKDYYGMEVFGTIGATKPYPVQELPGSCYWVPDDVFKAMIDCIVHNAARVGIRVLVGTGHCPSSDLFASMAEDMKKKYNVTLLTPDMGNPDTVFVPDHAAKIETSNIMYLRPELVHMENLPQDKAVYPLAISGDDPRGQASPECGKQVVQAVEEHIIKLVGNALSVLD